MKRVINYEYLNDITAGEIDAVAAFNAIRITDVVKVRQDIYLNGTLSSCLERLRSILKMESSFFPIIDSDKVYLMDTDRLVIIKISNENPMKSFNRTIRLVMYGSMFVIEKSLEALQLHTENQEHLLGSWFFMTPHGVDDASIKIKPPKDVYDSFYPYISEGVNAYIDKFYEDPSPILILMGVPGTGKSTFIKHLLHYRNVKPVIVYDEDIIKSDSLYIQFLTDDSKNILVLEDADSFITSKIETKNKVMSKLLNSSDGLVDLSNKKIIFTTNIVDIHDIDQALIRPGRCFDVLKFRPLVGEEIDNAIKDIKTDIQKTDSMTLAELFKRHEISLKQPPKKIGFV